jgi:site-specific recombinase XerD
MTVNEAIEKLMIALLADGIKDVTEKWNRVRLKRFASLYGAWDINNVDIDVIRGYIVWLRNDNLSPNYFYGHVRVIRRLFKWLYEERVIDDPFWKRIKLPKLPPAEPKGVDLEDVKKLLSACDDSIAGKRNKAIIYFLIDTGCRVGGLCRLKVDDIDFENLFARIIEKDDKPRKILFGEKTRRVLMDWLEAREHKNSQFVFTSLKNDCSMNPNSVIQMLRRLAKRTGVEGHVNPHAFRHGFAREYIKNGGDLASVSDLLGHDQIAVTKAYYAVFLIEEHREKHQSFSPVNYL